MIAEQLPAVLHRAGTTWMRQKVITADIFFFFLVKKPMNSELMMVKSTSTTRLAKDGEDIEEGVNAPTLQSCT